MTASPGNGKPRPSTAATAWHSTNVPWHSQHGAAPRWTWAAAAAGESWTFCWPRALPPSLDLSVEMLRLARESHPQLTFHHADICQWTPPRPYDFISAWDSVWHVPLPEQPAVLLKLCHALAPGGVLIFTAGGVSQAEERRDTHMGVPMYHATLGVPRICSLLAVGGCMLRHFEHDQHPQAHVYFIAQRA